MCYARFNNISDLRSLDANSTHNTLLVIIKDVSRHCQMSPGGQSHPQVRATVLDDCSSGRPLDFNLMSQNHPAKLLLNP